VLGIDKNNPYSENADGTININYSNFTSDVESGGFNVFAARSCMQYLCSMLAIPNDDLGIVSNGKSEVSCVWDDFNSWLIRDVNDATNGNLSNIPNGMQGFQNEVEMNFYFAIWFHNNGCTNERGDRMLCAAKYSRQVVGKLIELDFQNITYQWFAFQLVAMSTNIKLNPAVPANVGMQAAFRWESASKQWFASSACASVTQDTGFQIAFDDQYDNFGGWFRYFYQDLLYSLVLAPSFWSYLYFFLGLMCLTWNIGVSLIGTGSCIMGFWQTKGTLMLLGFQTSAVTMFGFMLMFVVQAFTVAHFCYHFSSIDLRELDVNEKVKDTLGCHSFVIITNSSAILVFVSSMLYISSIVRCFAVSAWIFIIATLWSVTLFIFTLPVLLMVCGSITMYLDLYTIALNIICPQPNLEEIQQKNAVHINEFGFDVSNQRRSNIRD
jgi:hypothetical protein